MRETGGGGKVWWMIVQRTQGSFSFHPIHTTFFSILQFALFRTYQIIATDRNNIKMFHILGNNKNLLTAKVQVD